MNILLIGNPNSGKTTLFNALTGSRQRVGNWPGVTVEKKVGSLNYQGNQYEVVDLPGTYAIENLDASVSQDEMIAREVVIKEEDNVIINIVDATNLQRSLYLSFQLLDLQRPMILVLNMIDALEEMGESINIELLSQQLGCPVVAVSAKKKTGFDALKQEVSKMMANPTVAQPAISTLSIEKEKLLINCLKQLPAQSTLLQVNRWQLLEALLDTSNRNLSVDEAKVIGEFRTEFADWCDGEMDIAIASARYEAIDGLTKQVIEKPREASASLSDKFDHIALGRITGIPFFLFIMYLMFMVAVNFGAVFIDFFDILFATIFVDGAAYALENIGAPDWLIVILAGGLGAGIQTVATFIPVIAAMFLCLSFLEDSGYLARAAMVVDRGMRAIGLPGKAFVPMLVGFGCGVPAVMGTRTLDSTRDRLMSICMIPFMSCGARLPVYALFAVIFFPQNASFVVFVLYMLGIMVAILTGVVLKYTLLPGKATPFVMELPTYRLPTLRGILTLTSSRLNSFILRAGKAIVIMVTVLSLLNSVSTDGSLGHSNTEDSVLSVVSQKISPVFSPMGVTNENWPATVGIFTGIFAKEAVIATLNSLYVMGESEEKENEEFDLLGGIVAAFDTIPENLIGLTTAFGDPLGLSAIDEDLDSLQKEFEISESAVTKIETSFVTSTAAMAYLIFILLYTPCAAALGSVYREAGTKWTVFVAVWTFILGWLFATSYYQYTLLGKSSSAVSWLVVVVVIFVSVVAIMKVIGNKMKQKQLTMNKVNNSSKSSFCC